MAETDYAEDYGLFEYRTARRKYLTKSIQRVNWNPIFWISVLFTIFSTFTFILHVYWKYFFGGLYSFICTLFGAVCIYLCVLVRSKKQWHQLQKGDYAKVAAFCVFILVVQALFLTLSVELLKIHFSGPDAAWSAFPNECAPNMHSGSTILNCVRTGPNIPNPYTNPGLDPISSRTFEGDVPTLLSQLTTLARLHIDCTILHTDVDWAHLRCISAIMGIPSDLGLRVVPDLSPGYGTNSTSVSVWIHCQSRLGEWDWNENDARVRLLFTYKALCDMSQSGINCSI